MIPQAKKGDAEAVAHALATAGTMHALGDRAGALKWLRRATEAAADADADDRTLELAKAAADLASTTALPRVADAPPPGPLGTGPLATAPAPDLPKPHVPAADSPSLDPAPQQVPGLPPAVFEPAPRPATSRAAAGVAKRPSSALAVAPPAPPTPESPASATPAVPVAVMAPRAPAERATFLHPVPPRPALASAPGDPWLVEVFDDDDLGDTASEKTRVGVPAYGGDAKAGADPLPSAPPRVEEPALRPSQAMRVVVWRAADGVHVAPRGTQVAAIAVDAVLVALDPSTDLAAWLSGK